MRTKNLSKLIGATILSLCIYAACPLAIHLQSKNFDEKIAQLKAPSRSLAVLEEGVN